MKKIIKNHNNGSATVEAVVGFTAFMFTVFTILNIVNYCRAQALISNAIDTAAKEISQYSYFYDLTGLDKVKKDFSETGEVGADNLNDVVSSVDGMFSAISNTADDAISAKTDLQNTVESGEIDTDQIKTYISAIKTDKEALSIGMQGLKDSFGDISENPMKYLKSIVAVAGNTVLDTAVSHLIAAPIARSLTLKHFGSTTEEADAMLKSLGVVDGVEGLNFNMSTLFASGSTNDIQIVVYYKLQLTSFFKGVELEATCSNCARARAWLGGDKEKVQVEKSVDAGEDTSDINEDEVEENKNAGKTDVWALEGQEINYNDARKMTFLKNYSSYVPGVYNVGSGTFDVCCQQGTTAYGMTIATDPDKFGVESPENLAETVKGFEDLGKNNIDKNWVYTDGRPLNGLGPNEIDSYHLTVFVPEDMSQADKDAITASLSSKVSDYDKVGYTFTYEIIPAGGTYGYSTEES